MKKDNPKEIYELRASLARCVDFIQTNIDCNCSREVDQEYNWIGECSLCKFLKLIDETAALDAEILRCAEEAVDYMEGKGHAITDGEKVTNGLIKAVRARKEAE